MDFGVHFQHNIGSPGFIIFTVSPIHVYIVMHVIEGAVQQYCYGFSFARSKVIYYQLLQLSLNYIVVTRIGWFQCNI